MEEEIKYNILKPWTTLDPWQKEYIATKGNCHLVCGRQSGKSAAASIKFGTRACENMNRKILMIAYTERQAYELFFKTLIFIEAKYPNMLKKGKERPTKHEINLKNGSKIMCYAAGLAGEGIRGFTITDLVIDEAAAMAREVFVSCMPMLSVTGGSVDMLSTPRGKEGFFYECSLRDDFKKFQVSAEDCPRHKKEFLEAEKKRMTTLEYAQEYLAQFLDEFRRLISDDLIKKVCTNKRPILFEKGDYFLGADIAGMGRDETTLEIVKKIDKENYVQVENIILTKQMTTQVTQKILDLNESYKFRKIFVDDAGIGFGVFCELMLNRKTAEKTIPLNNSARAIPTGFEREKRTRILKEDLYNNLLVLMEKGYVKLLDDDEIKLSLASIQKEFIIEEGKPTKLRIYGRDSHIAEGIIRACWCSQDKSLKLWIA